MEYRLIVMRHAKSDWNTEAPTDHARPLNKRGCRDAPRIASRLVELGWEPQYVVSSDSQRTTETFELMEGKFLATPSVEFHGFLYHGGISQLEEAVSAVPEEFKTVLALGHNPGWQDSVQKLTGEYEEFTTANAALMSIEAESWTSAIQNRGEWRLVQIVRPKELDD